MRRVRYPHFIAWIFIWVVFFELAAGYDKACHSITAPQFYISYCEVAVTQTRPVTCRQSGKRNTVPGDSI
jgi:hypothetical protein